jgi:hypothetical protein
MISSRKRIGDRGDPCGTPAASCKGAVSSLLTSKVVVRSIKNDRIVRTNQNGTCFFGRLSSSRVWFTVSNALKWLRIILTLRAF